jgi:glycosyltransferase domain-containing protein
LNRHVWCIFESFDQSMKNQLTIIIPTHNRPALIARALDYYRTWGCSIIVCDSSRDESNPVSLPDVQILYTPELSFDRKLFRAVQQVTTPYVCLSADDDFLSVNGVMTGMRFLEKHDDYVSVQGHYLTFGWNKSELDIHPNYVSLTGFHIDDAEPAQRILHAMYPFMHHIYSVHRSNVLQKSLAISLDYNSPPLAEFSTALGGMIFGKHQMLPIFWMARDVGRYSNYNDNLNDQTTLIFDISKFLATRDGLSYQRKFAETYAAYTGESVDRGSAVFEQAFLTYLSHQTDSKRGLAGNVKDRARQFLRQLAPEFLLEWRRRLIQNGILPRNYPELPGYPWSDPDGKKEWMRMKEIIVKHGQFATVEDKRLS